MLYREPSLAEREAIYRQVTSTAGVGAFTWDLTAQQCLWCSEQLAQIYEGTVEDYLREMGTDPQIVSHIHPDDVDRYVALIQSVMESKGSYRISYRGRIRSGRYVHVVEAAETYVDPSTGHLLMVGCVIDETPHKQIESVLREANETLERKVAERTAALEAALARAEEAESRFLAAAQALQEGLAIFNVEDRLTFFNDRHVALLPEHARSALKLGRTFREMVEEVEATGPVYHADMGGDFVSRRLAMHEAASGEVLVRYADDHWVLIKEGRMADGGRVILTTDVTEDQRREQRLRLLATAVEQAGDSVEICDQDYRLIYVNPAFSRLTGWTSEEALGCTPASLLRSDAHDRAFYEDIERTVEAGRTWNGRIVSRHREGRLIHQEATISPLFDDTGRLTHSLAIKRDVTREVETRAALAESQARLAAFMLNAPVGMYVKSLEGRYLMANPEMERVFGMPLANVLGRTAAEVFGPHEAEFIAQYDQEVIQSGETSSKEEFLPDVSDYAWSLVLRFPIKDHAGRTMEIAGFDVDITAQKMAQERMAASEAFFRSIVEDQSEYIIRLDPNLTITFVNAAFARKRGEAREAIVARRMLDLIAPADRDAYRARLASLTTDQPTVSTEVVIAKPDGSTAHEQWTDRVIFDETGNLVGFQSVGRDVTAERRAEAELRRSERGFRELVEAHPMPLAVMRMDTGQPLFASASFLGALGISLADMRTGDIRRFYADPEERARIYARLRAERGIEAIEVTLRRSDGTTFPALMRCRVTTLGGRDVVLSSFVDLTDQKRLEEEMERQRDALYQSEKLTAMGSLLAGVAHELNNPLSVVIGQAEMLLEEATDGVVKRRAERIQRNADRCARIVRTFLAIARQKSRDRKLVAVEGLVEGAIGLAAYGFKADGVEVVQEVAPDLPAVLVDEDQMHQVLTNILVNAQQALRDQEGPKRLVITAQAEAAAVVLTIEDNGPGVPEANRSRIFEPFFTTKPIGVGTGLGLALCHAIITSHGGTIAVENVAGGGARFVIRLPAGAQAAAEAPPASEGWPDATQAVVLIVDDEPEIVELLSEALALDGHRILVAPNGREALEVLKRQRVDLVLTDLRLPEIDGQRLQSLAAQLPDPPPFLFMTGDTLSAGKHPNGELPSPLIEKPLRPADVRSAVARELSAETA
ncbi:MAG TPA: PAS domain S-box protein [Geminicoccus sp.]|uniref:PAS domain S-box protein n=1 Tax=Geminicoccus sp. TaxID=2024832 RepID=UPI002E316F06|nr:PAS domain S-box protein [Geminicoccus sp.]HEX2529558.1 PAS domain S-box protein [Geminicoccus sp.]